MQWQAKGERRDGKGPEAGVRLCNQGFGCCNLPGNSPQRDRPSSRQSSQWRGTLVTAAQLR